MFQGQNSSLDDDVSLLPGINADKGVEIGRFVSADIADAYDVYSYRHAAAILSNAYPESLSEIENALRRFSMTNDDIAMPGGNESIIPKKFSEILRPLGWNEARIQCDLHVNMMEYGSDSKRRKTSSTNRIGKVIPNFISGHKIDFVKGEIALEMEWNSKDQTFDRDLYALKTFHDCGIISVGVMITRSEKMNLVFDQIEQLDKKGNPLGKSIKSKYGASTTWMGKLLYRLNANRQGNCPILVFGITPKAIK